jgi:predicted nucleotidyltransferase
VTGSPAPSIDVIQQVCKGYFEGVPEVDVVYLFGSYADGSAGLASDIDLAVLYKRALSQEVIREAFLRDWAQVSRALKTDSVDLVCLNAASSIELKFAVVQDGKVILDRSDNRVEYEYRIRSEYFDHIATLRLAGFKV